MKNIIVGGLFASLVVLGSCSTAKSTMKNTNPYNSESTMAKNTILMIVDGMGFEHVKAARIYNAQKPLNFEQFACQTQVTTCPFEGADKQGICLKDSGQITDSAAAATAMATGIKVSNGAISRGLPDYHGDLETLAEYAKRLRKSTGIIATKLFTDATPAAFVSHANDRGDTEEILRDMFFHAQPNVVFGADTPEHRLIAKESKNPYNMVHSASNLKKIAREINDLPSCNQDDCPYVYGGFGQYDMIPGAYENKSGLPLEITPSQFFSKNDIPHLSEMTDAALKILNKNQQGFFLMVESSMPDMISHYNSQIDASIKSPDAIEVLIREMLEVQRTVEVIENFVKNNPDTLVIITADHETGGLVIEQDKTACLGEQACVPHVRWISPKYDNTPDSAAQHTAANVPLYAMGQFSKRFCQERINNTDIHTLAIGK